jgi:hypothetical protein
LVAWALVAELAGGIVSIGADIVDSLLVIVVTEKEIGLQVISIVEWVTSLVHLGGLNQ